MARLAGPALPTWGWRARHRLREHRCDAGHHFGGIRLAGVHVLALFFRAGLRYVSRF